MVPIWTQHSTALERSSCLMISRQMTPFFNLLFELYPLVHVTWTLPIGIFHVLRFIGFPLYILHYVLVCKIQFLYAKDDTPSMLSEHQQEIYVTRSRFLPLRASVGEGGWVNPLKRGQFMTKMFFQIMLNEVLKNCEKWYLLMWKLI